MKKRLLSLVMVLTMIMSFVPVMNVLAYSTGDDYPSSYKAHTYYSPYYGNSNTYYGTGIVDPWNFYTRECVSFVAWCLNTRNGVNFTNQYAGASAWGNAKTWGTVAQSLGITVNTTPAVGAVAWWNTGNYGHVAWVESVSGSNVIIEEYNTPAGSGNYNRRTIAASNPTGYIHIKDIGASVPDNSCRFQVTATDGINIRSGAGTGYSVVGAIPYQAYFTITERATANGYTWGKTTYGGVSGWCVLDFAKHISGTLPAIGNTATPTPTPKYTITYNANGGSGAPSAQTKTHNTTLALSSTKPTRSGYNFLGWATSASASTASYQPGGSFTTNANTTLYAVWSINKYTISYNANGGSGAPSAQTKTHDKTLALSTTKPTRTGYSFLGWSTSSSASTATYQPGGSFTTNTNTTLYAVWRINTYNITYNLNGGTGDIKAQTKTHGTAVTLSDKVPTREGHTFLGWAKSSSATSAQYSPSASFAENADTTLFAVWKINTFTVTFDANGGQNPPEPQTKVYGTALTLTKTRPVRANYSFEGWNTKADGTGTTYAAGGSYTANSAVTLYAMWDPNAVSVTLDPNGGVWYNSAEMQILWNKYDRVEELEMPKREGFELAGFTLDSTSDAVVYPYGKPLFTDTRFEDGMNGMNVYDWVKNDGVTLERVAASSDCPTKSDYMVKINVSGKTYPSYGGYVQWAFTKSNGIYYHIIVAKIPKGFMLYPTHNSLGDYSRQEWLTPNYGTGEWETYVYRTICGSTGTFQDLGYVYLVDINDVDNEPWKITQEVATPENPVTWYVAYSNIFDATSLDNSTSDPWFTNSNNKIGPYNNGNAGAVKIERVLSSETTEKYDLKITSDGTILPQYGGFIQPATSKPNGVFYHYIYAKIPKGYSINISSNSVGDNSKFTWISGTEGTGEYKSYIYKLECGNTGKFSTFGHVFLSKTENCRKYDPNFYYELTTTEPITWYVRYSNMIDMTPQYKYGESGKLTARWSAVRCADAEPSIKMGNAIFAETPISLSCDTEGARIYYTTDGTYPTEEKGIPYTGAFYLPAGDVTLRTIAFCDGYSASYDRTYYYTVNEYHPETSTAVGATSSYYNVSSEISNPMEGKYILALYNSDDELVQTVIKDITNTDVMLDFKIERTEDAAYAKVFIWNDINGMMPYSEMETVYI